MTSHVAIKSAFFAYASKPELAAESMRRAAEILGRRADLTVQTWQDMAVEGRVLIRRIQECIDAADLLVAEITNLNYNVLFEVGYAISKGKAVLLLVDETQEDAPRHLKSFGLLNGIGYANYGGDSQNVVARVLGMVANPQTPAWSDISGGFRIDQQPRTLFFFPTSLGGDAPRDLDRLLKKRANLVVLRADEDERGYAPLDWYAELIFRSTAGIFYFLGPTRTRADLHNARASLLAGVSEGLGRSTLLVAESSFDPPVDYQDLLYQFGLARQLTTKVNAWLDQLPVGLAPSPERLPVQLGLGVKFGEYVAENEREELGDYFVDTAEFQAVLTSESAVFVGRKGTGKTANMLRASAVLQADRRVLVVPIKPGAYELETLVAVIDRLSDRDLVDFFLDGLWEYLLLTQIGVAAVWEAQQRAAGIATGSAVDELRLYLERRGITPDQDLGVRLDKLIGELQADLDALPPQVEAARHFLNEHLHELFIRDLRRLLGAALVDRDRVAVLIDNLDKTWERGVDYPKVSRVIFGLLTAVGKVSRSFARQAAGAPSANVTLAVFLRADIFSQVLKHAREPDKIKTLQIRWENEDLLARVIEDRYEANNKEGKSGAEVWDTLFCPSVASVDTRSYLLWRCLHRPRDLVYLANSAVMNAVNRQNEVVSTEDIREAEAAYSQFAFEALLVESDPDAVLGDLLFEFAGLPSTLGAADVETLIRGRGAEPDPIIGVLMRASFLGIEVRPDEYEFISDENSERKARVLAGRLEVAEGRRARYRVHPAFRPYLEIVDDDLE